MNAALIAYNDVQKQEEQQDGPLAVKPKAAGPVEWLHRGLLSVLVEVLLAVADAVDDSGFEGPKEVHFNTGSSSHEDLAPMDEAWMDWCDLGDLSDYC
jgi:hypothetical protein